MLRRFASTRIFCHRYA